MWIDNYFHYIDQIPQIAVNRSTLTGEVIVLLEWVIFMITAYAAIHIEKKLKHQWQKILMALTIVIYPVIMIYLHNVTTTFLEYVIIAFVSLFGIQAFNYLQDFEIVEYAIIFDLLMVTTTMGYGLFIIEPQTLIFIYAILLYLVKIRYGDIKGKMLFVCLAGTILCAHIILFRIIYYIIFRQPIRGYGWVEECYYPPLFKGAAYLLMTVLFIGIVLLLIRLEKKLLQKWITEVGEFSCKYKEVDYYFIFIMVINSLLLVMCYSSLKELGFDSRWSVVNYLNMTFILLFCTQIIYLNVLVKTVKLKEHLAFKNAEQENLILYSNNLEANMSQIRSLKHDMKNLFLTMGEFVNRSTDEQMKAFYKEKIFPVADYELRVSDLLDGLQAIKDEQFKAFLFYKLNVAVSQNINVSLLIEIPEGNLSSRINYTDIIRIIGIFVDNAIEEAVQVKKENREVTLRIINEVEGMNIVISNAVRECVIQKGVTAGITTKGLGRGNGLKIVNEILTRYDNVILNTYFKENIFVQNLKIYN